MAIAEQDAETNKALRRVRVSRSVTDAAIRLYLESLDCGESRLVLHYYQKGDADSHRKIGRLRVDPSNYLTAEDFERAYLATEFLRKSKFLNTGIDTAAVAMESLRETEEACYATNERFRDLGVSPDFKGANVWLLNAVTQLVPKILGEFDVDEVLRLCAWGPGATFTVKGENTSSSKKFQQDAGITKDCYQLWSGVLKAAYPLWWEHLVDAGFPHFIEGNRVSTVDKDAEKDRTISIEPGLNSWFQKGIGSLMVARLRLWGVDLHDQTPNQRLARKGSVDGSIATVDLRNASNTIAWRVVMALLARCDKWRTVLDATRSHFGLIDGKWKKWEMFSSMGNGFTFPLQTIIFFAAARSCCEYLSLGTDDVVVYGDDVLLPTAAVSLFTSFCEFLGFSVNSKKTHVSGPFRESCGAHWWRGVNVKPILIKERLSTVCDVYKLANAIRRLSTRSVAFGCDVRFKRPWLLLYNCIPKQFRYVIPDEYGDGGFVGNLDEASPSYKRTKAAPYTRSSMVEGCHVRQVVERGENASGFEHTGQLLAALERVKATQTMTFHVRGCKDTFKIWVYIPHPGHGWFNQGRKKLLVEPHGGLAHDTPAMGNSAPLRQVTKLCVSTTLIHRWYDLGPWQ